MSALNDVLSFPNSPSKFLQETPRKSHTALSFNFSPVPFTQTLSTRISDVRPIKAITEDKEVDSTEKTNQENEKTDSFKNGTGKDRFVNAAIVLGAGTLAITKLLTIDHDYWQGWTFYEILRYAPEHNWVAYEEALKKNPVLAKMAISGIVYSLGDWIAQCYEGKPLFEFDRTRMFRSGIVGFSLHGSLSHYYYQFCEALFPYNDWWVVPGKVIFDQTIWAAIWNSIYFVALGFLRLESAANTLSELKTTFWPMLTAGWKLWPFAHLITYGVIPLEQRLLWVDCVELVWVTILSTTCASVNGARMDKNRAKRMEDKQGTRSTEPAWATDHLQPRKQPRLGQAVPWATPWKQPSLGQAISWATPSPQPRGVWRVFVSYFV